VATDPHPLAIGRLSQYRANRSVAAFATITLPGERQEIFGPDMAVLVAGQTTERHVLFATRQSTTPVGSRPPSHPTGPGACNCALSGNGQCRGGSTLPWFGNGDSRSTTLA
jgi:hypothetical protein